MRNFKITLKNTKTRETNVENITKLTFSEAVVSAYTFRTKLGFDWNIISIKEAQN